MNAEIINGTNGRAMLKIEGTQFTGRRNFAGKMLEFGNEKKSWKSDKRIATILITEDVYNYLESIGCNAVRAFGPTEKYPDADTRYTLQTTIGQNLSYWPELYLCDEENKTRTPITVEEAAVLDAIRVSNVNAIINLAPNQNGGITPYIKIMYITQSLSDDPWAAGFLNK